MPGKRPGMNMDGDWSGNHKDEHKWLLNNACMVEMYSEAAQLDW